MYLLIEMGFFRKGINFRVLWLKRIWIYGVYFFMLYFK